MGAFCNLYFVYVIILLRGSVSDKCVYRLFLDVVVSYETSSRTLVVCSGRFDMILSILGCES